MALKKKGTPAKMEVVPTEADLEKWKKFINSCISTDTVIVKDDKKKGKNKS